MRIHSSIKLDFRKKTIVSDDPARWGSIIASTFLPPASAISFVTGGVGRDVWVGAVIHDGVRINISADWHALI